ncbi:MAG TPA: peptidylprolyl isomerase [Caulobacteraceae bacterium]|jgi:peptidylprolyl isomerase|nr:peptidylprolyl isomerase [Caulobacteraceae bacterium]
MSFRLSSHGAGALALALSAVMPVAVHAAPAAPAAPAYAPGDWKPVDPQNLMVIDTGKGRIVVELVPALSPEHVERIKTLARQGYYDGLKFFRVIDEFMAQTGDKANTGAGESGLPTLKGAFTFRRGPETAYSGLAYGSGGSVGFIGPMAISSQPDELMALTADGKVKAYGLFCAGVAGMARTNDPDSASAQFFLMRQTFPTLNSQYTPFGRVVAGLDVVRKLQIGEPPANPDVMLKVRMASDMPAAERPNVWRVDPTSAAFRAHLAASLAAKGPQFSPCDVDLPSEIRK